MGILFPQNDFWTAERLHARSRHNRGRRVHRHDGIIDHDALWRVVIVRGIHILGLYCCPKTVQVTLGRQLATVPPTGDVPTGEPVTGQPIFDGGSWASH